MQQKKEREQFKKKEKQRRKKGRKHKMAREKTLPLNLSQPTKIKSQDEWYIGPNNKVMTKIPRPHLATLFRVTFCFLVKKKRVLTSTQKNFHLYVTTSQPKIKIKNTL